MRSGGERTARRVKVVAIGWLAVGRENVQRGGEGRAFRGAAMDTRERLPVGQAYVRDGGGWRAPRGASVIARERQHVELGDVRGGGKGVSS